MTSLWSGYTRRINSGFSRVSSIYCSSWTILTWFSLTTRFSHLQYLYPDIVKTVLVHTLKPGPWCHFHPSTKVLSRCFFLCHVLYSERLLQSPDYLTEQFYLLLLAGAIKWNYDLTCNRECHHTGGKGTTVLTSLTHSLVPWVAKVISLWRIDNIGGILKSSRI